MDNEVEFHRLDDFVQQDERLCRYLQNVPKI